MAMTFRAETVNMWGVPKRFPKGFLDIQEREREMQLGVSMVPSIMDDGKDSTVINAEYKFAKKRYTERYLWKPSRELEVAIVDAVFSS